MGQVQALTRNESLSGRPDLQRHTWWQSSLRAGTLSWLGASAAASSLSGTGPYWLNQLHCPLMRRGAGSSRWRRRASLPPVDTTVPWHGMILSQSNPKILSIAALYLSACDQIKDARQLDSDHEITQPNHLDSTLSVHRQSTGWGSRIIGEVHLPLSPFMTRL